MPGGNKGEGNISNGLYHFGARYYDPTTGRWTQQDPEDHLGSTTQGNRFLFAGSDPINLSDPSGRLGEAEEYGYACIAGAAAGGGPAGCAAGAAARLAPEISEPAANATEYIGNNLEEKANNLEEEVFG